MHHSFIPTVYENFKPVFLLNWNRQKSRNWHTRLIWEIEWIKAVEVFSLDNILINGNYLKNRKLHLLENYFTWECYTCQLSYCHAQWNSYLKNFILNSRTALILICTWNKKASSCRWNIAALFGKYCNFSTYMVNSFLV